MMMMMVIIIILLIIIIIIIIIIISNGNRTEWSPIRSVIIRVINKIGRPRNGSPICLITSMITDRIGRHDVLLPINHNFSKICDIISYFFKSKHKKFEILFNNKDFYSAISVGSWRFTTEYFKPKIL